MKLANCIFGSANLAACLSNPKRKDLVTISVYVNDTASRSPVSSSVLTAAVVESMMMPSTSDADDRFMAPESDNNISCDDCCDSVTFPLSTLPIPPKPILRILVQNNDDSHCDLDGGCEFKTFPKDDVPANHPFVLAPRPICDDSGVRVIDEFLSLFPSKDERLLILSLSSPSSNGFFVLPFFSSLDTLFRD